ncbi:restriction endonuclease PLD domain-containing protein [Lagierella sp.]|uniref:restriction endonuclease PLD domain-containing protein n=1 Tax=Lagierella sp. TaxID=2849657 RepID=UPI002634E1E9|nr:restriction endonuclease PLD domain-containing protein [Lagierella sp.]
MELENLNLFNEINENNKVDTVHIIKDEKEADLTIEEIFNKDKFDHFIGVTYSISPNFVNEYLKDFKTVEIVIGIDNEGVKSSINELAKHLKDNILKQIQGDPIKFYEDLNKVSKYKLDKGHLKFWVSTTHIIHSKFYILWNDEGENRLVLGSANLSNRAFDRESYQFENVVILDDSELFNIYLNYYKNNLSKVLSDYIPKELKRINAKNFKNVDKIEDINVDDVFILSNEEVGKIKEKSVVSMLDEVKDKIGLGICKDSIIQEMDNISNDRDIVKREKKEEEKAEEIAYEIVHEAINKRKKEPAIKSKQTLEQQVRKKIEKIVVKKLEGESEISRDSLYSKIDLRNTKNNITGLFVKSDLNKSNLTPFDKRANDDDLLKSLKSLNNYMQGFEKYANDYNDEYGKRIFESILCIFTAPFVYELREKLEIEENRLDIPQFVFIGGEAGSGKSSLLSIMSKLIGINKGDFYLWKDLLGTRGNSQKKDRINRIQNWIMENNVNPILVDEIDNEFFTKTNYGRDFIVDTANVCIRRDDSYPILIATTNTKSYALPKEARRRSYYLIIDRILKKSQESTEFFKNIYESIDNTLFSDFCYRMSQRLESAHDYKWDNYTEDNSFDFLFNTREIFKEYYEEAEMPLPRYFPEKKYNDDTEANREKWANLYRGSKELFVYDKDSGHMFFQITSLDENYRTYGASTGQIYADALPQEVCVGSVHGVINIELYTDKFFEWIEVENPYEKKSLIDRIFGR